MKLFVKRLAIKPDESGYRFVTEEIDISGSTGSLGVIIELDGGRQLTFKQVKHDNGPNEISVYAEETLAVKPRACNFVILCVIKHGDAVGGPA